MLSPFVCTFCWSVDVDDVLYACAVELTHERRWQRFAAKLDGAHRRRNGARFEQHLQSRRRAVEKCHVAKACCSVGVAQREHVVGHYDSATASQWQENLVERRVKAKRRREKCYCQIGRRNYVARNRFDLVHNTGVANTHAFRSASRAGRVQNVAKRSLRQGGAQLLKFFI